MNGMAWMLCMYVCKQRTYGRWVENMYIRQQWHTQEAPLPSSLTHLLLGYVMILCGHDLCAPGRFCRRCVPSYRVRIYLTVSIRNSNVIRRSSSSSLFNHQYQRPNPNHPLFFFSSPPPPPFAAAAADSATTPLTALPTLRLRPGYSM